MIPNGPLVFALVLAVAPAPAPDTLRITSWLVAGPFSSGSREALVDPLAPLDPAVLIPAAGDSLPSHLAPGGFVRWTPVAADGDRLELAYEEIDWDALADQWGVAGLVSTGFAFGELETGAPASYLIEAAGVATLYIDGKRYLGNPYLQGVAFASPLRLEAGRHRVMLRTGGMGPREVRFRLVRDDTPLAVLARDLTLPDLVAEEPLDGWGAAPIVNLSGRAIRGAVLRFGDGERIERAAVPIPPLEPETILKLPFPVRIARPLAAGERCPAELVIEHEGRAWATACSLRVRDPRASRLVTFRSAEDGSIQKYGVLPPAAGAPAATGPFALILTLHGASGDPVGQVEAYSPKDWAYVVAPTNTRPFGFDWQDWGRRNALETLDDALARFPVDPDRAVLTGHSMGGHGVWHVGLAHADRFAALAPSAGWASHGLYVPFTLRRDALMADPRLVAIWQRAIAPDNPLAMMRNARGVPIFVLHGAKDDNVPVLQGRLLAERARAEGARVVYREVEGMGHWWDVPATPGVDCVDLPEMMEFLRAARRDPHPRAVSLSTADLGTCDRAHWLVVEEALHPFDRVEVEAEVAGDGRGFALTTAGARALAIDPQGLLAPGRIAIAIDGDSLRADWREGAIHVLLEQGRWRIARAPAATRPARGPIKAAFFAPFVLAYGTAGGTAETEAARRLAVLDAQAWYLRADGHAPVLPDTAVPPDLIATHNLILYATPGSNALLERMAARLPIRIDRDGVAVGRRRYAGGPLAARFASANPLAPGRLVEVVAGTDLAGLELAGASIPFYSGAGYPDFVVYDARARELGWGGMRAAGFFDREGKVPEDGRDAVLR